MTAVTNIFQLEHKIDSGLAEQPTPTKAQRTIALLALWTVCVYPFSVNIVDPDLWGHVQYAQDWLSDGVLPRVSTHTFTAIGHTWVNHENLSELILAIGFSRLGNVGMLWLKFGLGIGLLLVAWRESRRQSVSIGAFLFVGLFVAYSMHPFWLFRPQMATWLGMATMAWLLNHAFIRWHDDRSIQWGYLAGLGPLFVVWTNAHGGFLAGLCLLGAYLFGRAIEAVVAKDDQSPRAVVGLVAIGVMTSALTLLNPYGIGLHLWLIRSLAESRPEIIEWHRPSILAPVFAPFFFLLFVSLIAWAASSRRRDWTHGFVLLLTLSQALLHIRHIGLFAILALFWVPAHVASLMEISFGRPLDRLMTSLCRRSVQMVCCVVLLVASIFSAHRLATLPVICQRYPVQALQFMNSNNLHGRLVVSFNWAQYAIAALQPKSTVGFDGRFRTCYPQHIIDKHFDLLVGNPLGARNRAAGGEFDPVAVLREGDPEFVLLDKEFPHSFDVMKKQSADFALLYEDNVAQLWGKRCRFPNAELVRIDTDAPNPEWPGLGK